MLANVTEIGDLHIGQGHAEEISTWRFQHRKQGSQNVCPHG